MWQKKGTYLNGMLSDSYILKQYKFQKQTLNFNCNLRESFCINSLRKISKVKTAYWGLFFLFSHDMSHNSVHHGNFQREKDLYWLREEVGEQGCDGHSFSKDTFL